MRVHQEHVVCIGFTNVNVFKLKTSAAFPNISVLWASVNAVGVNRVKAVCFNVTHSVDVN